MSPCAVLAQKINVPTSTDLFHLSDYAILPDKGYTFNQVRSDSTLSFTTNDSLRPDRSAVYWLKMIVANPSPNAESFDFSVDPYLNNTFYHFDANQKKWVSRRMGVGAVVYQARRDRLVIPIVLQGSTVNTFYVRFDLHALEKLKKTLAPKVTFERQSSIEHREQLLWVAWVCGITVLFIFFLNNLYIYIGFKYRIVFYYLISQLGCIIFLTAYRHFFHVLLGRVVFTMKLDAQGTLIHYDFNKLMMHIGIGLLLYGITHLVRLYLNTKKRLLVLDRALKYGLYAYLLFSGILALINTSFFYIESQSLIYDNILVMMLIGVTIYTCIMGYLRGIPAAGSLLLVNIVPFALILGTSFIHIFYDLDDVVNLLLPTVAILFQALGFSIALVARTKSIQDDLTAKETEANQLETDLLKAFARQIEIETENQKITAEILDEKSRIESISEKLEANQRELASTALYVMNKNKMLSRLKGQIQELNKEGTEQGELKEIASALQSNLSLDDDWARFIMHFEKVHPEFFSNAQAKYPTFTKNDLRLFAYTHINLSNKEIAAMLNIDPGSVRRAKTRLSQKMAQIEAV
ncbi:hypothetical protein LZD49_30700 [Dyadobacter sp. CY261]|uniref:7TM-DISM domain-containing protein n=1 Tax=Dyadobacter sp. CY261 TaxID=2907203 RepID=UPI001F4597ED|nr:7TM-DISM domain-containing protein [Dyadobacter sp. CY261]MCF0074895.1 hypothetical protein [Dyadobacter sp. CY261]